MATAVILAMDTDDTPITCRTLLDTCATANFVTEDFARTLRLPHTKRNAAITTMNKLQTNTSNEITITIKSRLNNFKRTLQFYTIPSISTPTPERYIERNTLKIPRNIRLADPEFNKPTAVQMLLSTGPTLATLCVGQINISPTDELDLLLQKTQLGWIIGGSIEHQGHYTHPRCYLSDVLTGMDRFWEIEDTAPIQRYSEEESLCEQHFRHHTQRNNDGRYIVALPFNTKGDQLGLTKNMAMKRLASLERRFKHNPQLQEQYTSVIDEYKVLGHAKLIEDNINNTTGYYLPHHAVIKSTSLTTKVRVVFDGSAHSTTGISLNDTLMVGLSIQDDLFSLLLRFRQHNYVLTGDIEKMYRQIRVREEDTKFQRMLWRERDGTLNTYELQTITFGLSAAPFLAVRCLHQLADDEGDKYPRAATTLKKDLYVDDLLTGTDTLSEAIQLRTDLTLLLQMGGFNIRQWASNSPAILEGLPDYTVNLQLLGDQNHTLKTLGVHWNSKQDAIVYTITPIAQTAKTTKRTIFSEIAKIFDPLGLVNPVIVIAKLLIQQLWKLDLAWDESVPMEIHNRWERFRSQLPSLNKIAFCRKFTSTDSTDIQIHGFCDASEAAYGACLYTRTTGRDRHIYTTLLCAKSRVAPLKNRQTIPRLELCAASLLVHLLQTVRKALTTTVTRTVLWSDSTIALNWIHTSPNTLKTFVANRVADIQQQSADAEWRHVRTHDNPADLLSRGTTSKDFLTATIWKEGPSWLALSEEDWPFTDFKPMDHIPETKRAQCLTTTIDTYTSDILQRYSSFKKLIRIITYCLRFSPRHRQKGLPTTSELQRGHNCIIRIAQNQTFTEELLRLRTSKPLKNNSKLLPLTAFLDSEGILRVGGRLQNSSLPYDTQHPIILPKSHHLTEMIIRQHHLENHHSGVQATLHNLRER